MACRLGSFATPCPTVCTPPPPTPTPTLPSLRCPAMLLACRNDCGSKMDEFLARCFYQPVS